MDLKKELKAMFSIGKKKELSDSELMDIADEHLFDCLKSYCEDNDFLSTNNVAVFMDGNGAIIKGLDTDRAVKQEKFTLYEFLNANGKIPSIMWRPARGKITAFEGKFFFEMGVEKAEALIYVKNVGGKPAILANTKIDGLEKDDGLRLTELLLNFSQNT